VGKAWRFIISCRYLLMACLVLAATWGYLFIPRPDVQHGRPVPAQAPPPLRQRYAELIECEKLKGDVLGLTESEVVQILGLPQQTVPLFDYEAWIWRDGQESVTIFWIGANPSRMISHQFHGPPRGGQ
jgi:hypothetical protein